MIIAVYILVADLVAVGLAQNQDLPSIPPVSHFHTQYS
jgi:hypothetical protein